ncbi:CHAD domain-containing protein [Chitiniphilus eburneus]|uniref:CHAD domain-containing protein n=1 Tax=Chitiniphilus eburneus TaxID=2571148 RepID=A0A4U0PG94_9NEIS|nr:CHAD domain-containing protein [Chitiniphilus eburneus]TJZ66122.1 CHAD domain-containing protein [Chitiniphilus eburneus]
MPTKKQLFRTLSDAMAHIESQRFDVLAGRDDALHQLRIALRGWRTLLPLALRRQQEDRAILAAWREFAGLTGPARDAEVLLAVLPADHPRRAEVQARRDAGYAAVARALESVDWPVRVAASRAWLMLRLDLRKRAALQARIRHRAERLGQHLRQDLAADPGPEHWHQVRIDVKKLRYLIDYAGKWLPRRVRKLRPLLKEAQSTLGDLHDLDVRGADGLALPDDAATRERLVVAAERAIARLRRRID